MDRMTSSASSSNNNNNNNNNTFGAEAFLLPGIGGNTRTRSISLPGSPASTSSKSSASSPSSASSASGKSSSSSSSSARKTNSLPLETVEYLKAWMMSPEHVAHPYPTEQEKAKIMADTGIELKQLTNWFVNNRKRFWKPRVEARMQHPEGVAPTTTTVPPPTPNSTAHPNNHAQSSASTRQTAPHLVTPTLVTPLKKVSSSSGIIALSDLTLGSALAAAGYGYLLEPQTSTIATTTTTTTANHPKLTPSSSSSSLNSSPARVSDHSVDSSASSETDSVCSSSDECPPNHLQRTASVPAQVMAGGERTAEEGKIHQLLTQTEYVNVHILRPSSHTNSTSQSTTAVPSIDDVVVLHNVPADRVLKSFLNCPLTYSVPMHDLSNSRKIQNCRDAEIVQLKALYLHQFLATPLLSSNPRKRPCPSNVSSSDDVPVTTSTTGTTTTTTTTVSPRPKFRRASLDVWREACTQSHHCYDDGQLPSLEEAAALFGFATS